MTELELISTEELSKEIGKRFDAIIIYGLQKNIKGNGISNYYDHYFGDYASLIGLCDLMKDKLISEFKINEGKGDEDINS